MSVPMRDDVHLATDLYFPAGAIGELPAILIRTPYQKKAWRGAQGVARYFARRGYVVAIQDVRGKGESQGTFTVSAAEREDGFDSISWLVARPWSSGKVGTYGCSYQGEVQMHLAAERHPSHTAAIAQAAGGALRYFGGITGGAIELSAGVAWFSSSGAKHATQENVQVGRELDLASLLPQLPIVDLVRRAGAPQTDWEAFVSHPPADPWWDTLGYVTTRDSFAVPTLHVNSWYDYGIDETIQLFNLMQSHGSTPASRQNQFLILSPATHCASEAATATTTVGDLAVGDARFDYYPLYVAWFDYWLKGQANDVLSMPPIRYYTIGRDEWRSSQTWPPPNTQYLRWFLHSDGRANSRLGNGHLSRTPPSPHEPSDTFTYDPTNPVPTVGGPFQTPTSPPGAFDQSDVELRADMLVYTSAPLDDGLEVTGAVEVVLYASSSTPDTDFTAKLVDVHPDGRAFNIHEGIMRARYRRGYDHVRFIEPGETIRLTISLGSTSVHFAPSHRIRLEVSSSSFPRWDRNLNTGNNNYDEVSPRPTLNTIHHSPAFASYLQLSISRDSS